MGGMNLSAAIVRFFIVAMLGRLAYPSVLRAPTHTALSLGQLVCEDILQERFLDLGRTIRGSSENWRFAGGFLDLLFQFRDSDLYVVSHT